MTQSPTQQKSKKKAPKKKATKQHVAPIKGAKTENLFSSGDGLLTNPLDSQYLGLPLLSNNGLIQRKLSIGASNDRYEQEADAVADRIMRMPLSGTEKQGISATTATGIQRKCAACEDEMIQRKPLSISSLIQTKSKGELSAAPQFESQLRSSQHAGQQLDRSTKQFMERGFGRDLSKVRIHTGSAAAQMNQEINARAFTNGNHIFFGEGQYQPNSPSGKHLLAHELTHTVQQGNNSAKIQRDGPNKAVAVTKVTAQLPHKVTFSGSLGDLVMHLETDIPAGAYEIRYDTTEETLIIKDADTSKIFNISLARATRNQILMHRQYIEYLGTHSVPLEIKEAKKEQTVPATPRDPNATYLTMEEIIEKCKSGDMPGVKVFPYRGTRFGAAPISAERVGDKIRVSMPPYVLANNDFRAQTRTLPTDTFIGGVLLNPKEIVRVRIFTPHWYQLNITGDATGDEQKEFCVTGEQMLQIAEASTMDTYKNIGLTVVDVGLFFVPIGKLLQPVAKGARTGLTAAMLGTAEVAPVAMGGMVRTGTVLVEQQAVKQVAQVPIRQTVAHTVVDLAEHGVTSTLAGQGALRTSQIGVGGMLIHGTGKAALVAGGDTAAGRGMALFGKDPAPPSGPISPELRQLYLEQFESKWFRYKMELYGKISGETVDWTALKQMVESAQFREYASAAEAAGSIGYAGMVEGQLIIGMAKPMRKIPILGKSSMQHEIVHVFQELTGKILTEETVMRNSTRGIIRLYKAELAAHTFGSPAIFITFGGFTLVLSGSAIYVYTQVK